MPRRSAVYGIAPSRLSAFPSVTRRFLLLIGLYHKTPVMSTRTPDCSHIFYSINNIYTRLSRWGRALLTRCFGDCLFVPFDGSSRAPTPTKSSRRNPRQFGGDGGVWGWTGVPRRELASGGGSRKGGRGNPKPSPFGEGGTAMP